MKMLPLEYTLFSLAADVADILKTIILMACLVEFVTIVYGIMKGERDTVDKAGKWIIVTVVVFVLISFVAGQAAGLANPA